MIDTFMDMNKPFIDGLLYVLKMDDGTDLSTPYEYDLEYLYDTWLDDKCNAIWKKWYEDGNLILNKNFDWAIFNLFNDDFKYAKYFNFKSVLKKDVLYFFERIGVKPSCSFDLEEIPLNTWLMLDVVEINGEKIASFIDFEQHVSDEINALEKCKLQLKEFNEMKKRGMKNEL